WFASTPAAAPPTHAETYSTHAEAASMLDLLQAPRRASAEAPSLFELQPNHLSLFRPSKPRALNAPPRFPTRVQRRIGVVEMNEPDLAAFVRAYPRKSLHRLRDERMREARHVAAPDLAVGEERAIQVRDIAAGQFILDPLARRIPLFP